MPEPESKKKTLSGEKEAKNSNASKTKQKKSTNNLTRPNIKRNIEHEIAKSKQLVVLVEKLQVCKSNSSGKSKSTTVKFCRHKKPMPSLAELEKMFEDSDDEEGPPTTNQNNLGTSTPIPKPQTSENSITRTSPKTIEKTASRMLDLASNFTELPIIIEADEPPSPVIKLMKRKKSGLPYIVGCKDRPHVPSKPNNIVFKGNTEYGLDKDGSDDEDDVIPKKQAKRDENLNLLKSTFNAASDETPAEIEEQDEGNSDASSNSNITIAYEYNTPNPNNRARSFSPLPSTSTDIVSIEKNDLLFYESLMRTNENASTTCNDNDSCESILINDTITNTESRIIEDPSVIELIYEGSRETTVVDTNTNIVNDSNNKSVQTEDFKPLPPIPVDEHYSSSCTIRPPDCGVCEVIDIDKIIAETTAVLKKYIRKKLVDTVTSVGISSSVLDSGTSVNVVNTTTPIDNVNTPLAKSTISTIGNNEKILQKSEQNVQLSGPINNQANGNAELLNNHQSHNIFQRSTTIVSEIVTNSSNSASQAAEQDAYDRRSQEAKAETSMNSQDEGNMEKENGECPICMDRFSNKTLASTMCGHVFCMNCLTEAIKFGKKCPTCRKRLRGVGFHQIFL